MKPILTDVDLEATPRMKRFRKGDLRPITGWPGGIDPYPEFDLDGFVETHVYGFDYKLKARQIGGIVLKLGDKIEHKDVSLYVTSVEIHQGQTDKVLIEAQGRTNNDLQTSRTRNLQA